MEHLAPLLSGILIVGIAAQWLAWRLKLPAILLLLLAGIILGPIGGWLDPDQVFGELLFPGVSLGVAIILFEGSLTLRLHEIRDHGKVVTRLVTLGALITWLCAGAASHWLLGLSWEVALLFGGLVSVTGPTVIVPILRVVKPKAAIANILRWEGILIDPIGAILVVLVFEFIVSGHQQGHTLWVFGEVLLVGALLGAAGAWTLAQVLRRHLVPEYLRNVSALAIVLGIFSTSNLLAHESGLLAVTVMGVVLANMKDLELDEILDFKETLTVLFISVLFILLAARLDPAQIWALGVGVVVLLLLLLLVIRPLAVMASTFGSKLNWRERALLMWIAPRGIVAAAVSALFALKLEPLGIAGAELLVPLTFAVIIVTVVVQSATARLIARALGVCDPEARGVLIFGGQQVALALGKALKERGFPVVLADTSWEQIRAARMAGLPTFYGNVVSEHADRHLDLVGLGRLFAMSRRPALNALAALRYRREFGADNVFALRMAEEQRNTSEKQTFAQRYRTPALFGTEVTFGKLASLLGQGASIRATTLTDSFDYAAYQARNGDRVLLLFAIDAEDCLRVFSDEPTIKPRPGWTLVALALPEPSSTLADSASA